MRDILFYLGTEIVTVRINNKMVTFRNDGSYGNFIPIGSLRLSREGVVKEFPYLKDSPTWREEAIVLFNKHIESLDSEEAIESYVIKDFTKHGYQARVRLRPGFRPEAIK